MFGPSKEAVVKAVFRWDQVGIKCEWYDWAGDNPKEHAYWFAERDNYRTSQKTKNTWGEADEAEYQEDCEKRSPETYRGWWILTNLPDNCSHLDWFSGWDFPEIIDPNVSVKIVAQILQQHTFDDWEASGCGEVGFCDQQRIDENIKSWRDEQLMRYDDYYGKENERD